MNNDIQSDIDMVKRHTSYTDDLEIVGKLEEHGGSAIKVITQYMAKVTPVSQRRRELDDALPISINQEIYRQLRSKMTLL